MKQVTTVPLVYFTMALLAISPGARAQVGIGPDLIVGSITGVSNYSRVTTPPQGGGPIDAFSIGTTACNISNSDVQWQANNNLHPVTAMNAFRYMDGRFEQVGQSWIMHTFVALSGNQCGSCMGPSGSVLSPGCSDPTGSGLNGLQSVLGPKSEVDAATGFFLYPFGGGAGSGSINRRLQVRTADLDPALNPNAQYFVEAQYVTQDDAAASNDGNNASYRAANVSFSSLNGEASMNLSGATFPTDPAIFAWKKIDPDVHLDVVDVPNDGRFWVGHKVTANMSGTFTWEFAVHNLNSHRSAQSFTVDLPAGTSVSNVRIPRCRVSQRGAVLGYGLDQRGRIERDNVFDRALFNQSECQCAAMGDAL